MDRAIVDRRDAGWLCPRHRDITSRPQPAPPRHPIGQSGSREKLNTTALIVDLDTIETDIAAMAAFGRISGVALRSFMGDEHGGVMIPNGDAIPALGFRLTAMTSHCDPTVNLYDTYHVVSRDTLVAIWPVTARGHSA